MISIGSVLAVHVPLLLTFSLLGTPWLWLSFPAAAVLSAAAAMLILRRTHLPERANPRSAP
ncbi:MULTISPECIES: hypothetical protein [Streptomyces]|uniref:hypothetical protein n=1 Tax=Streptomyces TaxID=1883 RepID=UPI000F550652|nr:MULTISPECIES: hypothetical protein [Streptomyces]RPK71188.1 hypothetical protein EES45_34970 [Streptomyces sp. ADI97-07]WRY80102.1 hypothetical protein OG388_02150 [Streptomyces clavifer]WRY86217.1 hypothetical protein OG388_35850 [Streptomyces clavifer]WRY86997.1 hypothetical protein OG388_38085 [Streptomyces clavifer]WUC25886.1 hypothetical protein OG927_00210 [Streptomyces clavifer]